MTGEQKPGGLEVVAWRYRCEVPGSGWMLNHDAPTNPQIVERPDFWTVQALTPAEPAEARIRELEARCLELSMLAYRWMEAHDLLKAGKSYNFPSPADLPTSEARATAAEAQLARAVEGLPDLSAVIAWLDNGCDPKHAADELRIHKARIDQTLAALQQEGE